MGERRRIIWEAYEFIKENQKYWLIPAIIAMIIFGFLIATAGTAPVPVFVYPVA